MAPMVPRQWRGTARRLVQVAQTWRTLISVMAGDAHRAKVAHEHHPPAPWGKTTSRQPTPSRVAFVCRL